MVPGITAHVCAILLSEVSAPGDHVLSFATSAKDGVNIQAFAPPFSGFPQRNSPSQTQCQVTHLADKASL